MKKKSIKQETINLYGFYVGIYLRKTTYLDFNFEVQVKGGTSNTTNYFHDAQLASEFFENKVKEYTEEKEKRDKA